MLEFRGEIALEIVFDDEDAEEIGIAVGAENVPGQGGHAERGDCGGMKKAEGIAPAFREQCPEKDGSSAENNGCRALCQHREPKENAKQNQGKPGSGRHGPAIP